MPSVLLLLTALSRRLAVGGREPRAATVQHAEHARPAGGGQLLHQLPGGARGQRPVLLAGAPLLRRRARAAGAHLSRQLAPAAAARLRGRRRHLQRILQQHIHRWARSTAGRVCQSVRGEAPRARCSRAHGRRQAAEARCARWAACWPPPATRTATRTTPTAGGASRPPWVTAST